ncbi:dnaJ homolog subfamily C member 1 [Erpetoichthys calabaricus]|uniref:DnaJ homolog subfamily C member 1 n=1 Tax=Erpetoichthys calabaricus TaxID=27687 RepID=A0A8C4X5A3_ERPCA|nr:dnaJ homolog subfamily C member 1 [Erpetoichthys calabaricus]
MKKLCPPQALLIACWLLVWSPLPVHSWESDLELFDLVEEVPQNFYEFLAVDQDASSADIRKAYRRLSLTLHPDKNKDENAEVQFRQLVAIYEVLKDDERRQRYDDILLHGLPDWRQPVFYYRRVRKMSNAELGLLLFIILTVGHYVGMWSVYLEKQLDELLSRKRREKRKKGSSRNTEDAKPAQERSDRLSDRPRWYDVLPVKLGLWFYFFLKSLPQRIQDARQFYEDYKEMKMKEREAALELAQQEATQREKKPKVKKTKTEFPEYADSVADCFVPSYDQGATIEEIEAQMNDWLDEKGKLQKKKAPEWTDEDLSQLTRSMVKFPGGTPGRWEKIAHELGRSVADVTSKVKQVKDCVASQAGTVKFSELKSTVQTVRSSKVASADLPDDIITRREDDDDSLAPADADSCEDGGADGRVRRRRAGKTSTRTVVKEEVDEKPKGRRQRDYDSAACDEDSGDEKKAKEEVWTQNQQKLLELALQQYPRGMAERWDKIAKIVPAKSKEECMARYKLLAELVQKRRQAQS